MGAAAVGSLEEVAGALAVADRTERQLVRGRIAEVERQPLHVDDAGERPVDVAWLETVRGERFAGQLVRRHDQVVYASLVARGRG